MKNTKSTMVELVQELEKIQPRTPAIQEMILEAKAGEYHDYKNQKYACGKIAVVGKLRAAGLFDLAEQIAEGDFDEEADEADIENMRSFTPKNMWPILGLDR